MTYYNCCSACCHLLSLTPTLRLVGLGCRGCMAGYSSVMPMAPAPMEVQIQRPSMRRKSSAQNLLSSFKSNPNPQPYPLGTVSSATGIPFVQSQQQPGPSSNNREWDVQSQAESLISSAPLLPPNGTPVLPQGNLEMLREVVKKRIITLTYLRNIHEGYVPSYLPSTVLEQSF